VLAGTPIIVSAALGDERAGVRRDGDGRLWIAHWTADRADRVAGTRLEGLQPAQITGPRTSAVGARLPATGRAVQVRDDDGTWHPAQVAPGAWVAFVERDGDAAGLPPVRLLDADGALVSRAEPGWIASSRALDRHERAALAAGPSGVGDACPACGADDWHAAPAHTDRSHASPSGGGTGEHVFCAVCGHNDGAVTAFFAAVRRT
jgi:hypothetical protein